MSSPRKWILTWKWVFWTKIIVFILHQFICWYNMIHQENATDAGTKIKQLLTSFYFNFRNFIVKGSVWNCFDFVFVLWFLCCWCCCYRFVIYCNVYVSLYCLFVGLDCLVGYYQGGRGDCVAPDLKITNNTVMSTI